MPFKKKSRLHKQKKKYKKLNDQGRTLMDSPYVYTFEILSKTILFFSVRLYASSTKQ